MGLALLPLVAAILSISIKADIKGPRPARVLFCGVAVAVPVSRQLKTQGMSVPTSLRYFVLLRLKICNANDTFRVALAISNAHGTDSKTVLSAGVWASGGTPACSEVVSVEFDFVCCAAVLFTQHKNNSKSSYTTDSLLLLLFLQRSLTAVTGWL